MSWIDENKVLLGICEGMKKKGFKAVLLDRYSKESIGEGRIRWLSSVYDFNEGPLYVGSIMITGSIFDQIQLFSRIVPSDVGAFRWYDIHFCVIGNVDGKRKDLVSTLKNEKNFNKLQWIEGTLSDMMNADDELKKMLFDYGLWRFHGDLRPTSSIRVRSDEKYNCTRVIIRMDRQTSKEPEQIISKTIESIKIVEKISQYIHKITD